jgi:hypothetical protein
MIFSLVIRKIGPWYTTSELMTFAVSAGTGAGFFLAVLTGLALFAALGFAAFFDGDVACLGISDRISSVRSHFEYTQAPVCRT